MPRVRRGAKESLLSRLAARSTPPSNEGALAAPRRDAQSKRCCTSPFGSTFCDFEKHNTRLIARCISGTHTRRRPPARRRRACRSFSASAATRAEHTASASAWAPRCGSPAQGRPSSRADRARHVRASHGASRAKAAAHATSLGCKAACCGLLCVFSGAAGGAGPAAPALFAASHQ